MDMILPPPGFSVWDLPPAKLKTGAVAATWVVLRIVGEGCCSASRPQQPPICRPGARFRKWWAVRPTQERRHLQRCSITPLTPHHSFITTAGFITLLAAGGLLAILVTGAVVGGRGGVCAAVGRGWGVAHADSQ